MGAYEDAKNSRIERIYENALELFIFFDESGMILGGNKTAKEDLGYKDGFEGVNITDVFPRVMRMNGKNVESYGLTEGKYTETVAYRKNLTCFAVDFRVIIEQTETGFLGICMCVNAAVRANAIKDMVKAKEKVEDAMKVRNEFVSNVTHELRTPVNGIKGISKNLMETDLNKDQLDSINVIQLCCSNMIQIINNLLDFSKMEAGKFTLEEREFSFHEFMDKTIAMNITPINEKGLKLLLNISSEIPDQLIGDELRISQIITNLLSNAVKFTAVGQIIVDVCKSMEVNGYIELFFMISDTGIGIAKEDMHKLFKSFSQVDASITRRFGGTGLGLAIVKELVELMDGEIQVDSEAGKGTTFSFSIRLKLPSVGEQKSAYEKGAFVYDGTQRRAISSITDESYAADELYRFGSSDNIKELKSTLEKLVICIEMENWEKAEGFASTVKKLVSDNSEIKKKAFCMEMVIRKSDHDNSLEAYNDFVKMLQDYIKEEELS